MWGCILGPATDMQAGTMLFISYYSVLIRIKRAWYPKWHAGVKVTEEWFVKEVVLEQQGALSVFSWLDPAFTEMYIPTL